MTFEEAKKLKPGDVVRFNAEDIYSGAFICNHFYVVEKIQMYSKHSEATIKIVKDALGSTTNGHHQKWFDKVEGKLEVLKILYEITL